MKLRFAVQVCVLSSLISANALAVNVVARVNRPYPVGFEIEFAANAVGTGEITYTWDFGDGQKSEESPSGIVTHAYAEPGHYPVIVVAKDEGSVRSASVLQTVHRPLPERAPASSSSIVYDRSRSRVCNTNPDNDTVSCLSTSTLELLFEAPVGRHPRTLAFDASGLLWVANQDDATLSILDEAGNSVAVVSLPPSSRPYGLVLNPTLDKAYVTLQALGEVAEIDVSARTLDRRTAAVPSAAGVSVSSDASRIFVTRFISTALKGEVVELDASTLELVRSIELEMDPGPDTEASARGVPNYVRAAIPAPDGSMLWVPSKKDNVVRGSARDGEPLTFETSVRTIVSLFDLNDNVSLLDQRVDMNNRALGLSLAFSPLGDYAFVGLMGNNAVEVLDAYDRRIVAGQFEVGKAPDGLVLDDEGRLYVHSFLSRSVTVLDAAPILGSQDFTLERIAEIFVSAAERLNPEVLLGKQIFYDAEDTRMSKDGYISCAACHIDGFEDGQVWDFTDRGEGLRNTTSLLGKRGVGQGRLHWSANFDEVQDFEHDIRGPFGGTGFLLEEAWNDGTHNETLGDPKAGLSPELDALAAYVTSLAEVHPSPFRDPDGSLTEAGWRGLEVFLSSGCAACHSGPDFTDSALGVAHDVGTISPTSGSRLGGTLEGIDTPTLRGIWETAPYLHDGSAATLMEVITNKNPSDLHGATASLSELERSDLVSYLLQIDNTALEAELEPNVEEPPPEEPPPEVAEPTPPKPENPQGPEPMSPEAPNPDVQPTPNRHRSAGCTVVAVRSQGWGSWGFLLMFLAARLARRRSPT